MASEPGKRPVKKRALLLYMAGDNKLSDAGLRDGAELCDEGACEDVYVGVEIDTYGEHTGSIRYEITKPEIDGNGDWTAYRQVIERLSERDSGKPATLYDFLDWGLKRFPAEELIVVVGGHGDGFRRPGRSLAIDEFGSALDMTEVEYVFERKPFDFRKRKIGILGFDACLMGMLEIAHHFSPFANYLVGSQQVEPGDGWPYQDVLKVMKKNSSLEDVGKGIVNKYIDHYVKKQVMADTTQCVVELAKTDAAMKALSVLGEQISKILTKSGAQTLNGQNAPPPVLQIDQVRAKMQSFADGEYVDLVHMAELLAKAEMSKDVTAACTSLKKAAKAAIRFNRVPNKRTSRKLRNANGLSIWFPGSIYSYTVDRAKYAEMKGVEEYPGWLNFLDQYFAMMRYK